jgi:hypothetical protein
MFGNSGNSGGFGFGSGNNNNNKTGTGFGFGSTNTGTGKSLCIQELQHIVQLIEEIAHMLWHLLPTLQSILIELLRCEI